MTNAEAQEEIFAAIEQNPDKPEAYWPLIVEFVAQYMENFYGRPDLEFRMPTKWREEMS